MATTTKQAKKTTRKVKREEVINAYMQYVLENGQEPETVYVLCKELGILEKEFYKHFGSLSGLQKMLWKDMVSKPVEICRSDEKFEEFSAREKLLAFYYTMIESLSDNRTFILWSLKPAARPEPDPAILSEAKKVFLEFCQEVIITGIETEEIIDRPVLGKRYRDAMWIQFLFVIQFWRKDDSPAFELTDAAIEKAVNLSFELMGKSALDTMVDFGKFLYQNRG